MGNVWETKIGQEPFTGGVKQALLSPYGNIVALLKETPYEVHTGTTKMDEAGDSLSAALQSGMGVNAEFAQALNTSLSDPKLRARVVELSQKDPDKLKATIGKIANVKDGNQMHQMMAADLMPAPVPVPPAAAPVQAPKTKTPAPQVHTASPATPPKPEVKKPETVVVQNPGSHAGPPAQTVTPPSQPPAVPAGQPTQTVQAPANTPVNPMAELIAMADKDPAIKKGLEEFRKNLANDPDLNGVMTDLEKNDPAKHTAFLNKLVGKIKEDPEFLTRINQVMTSPQFKGQMGRKMIDMIKEDPANLDKVFKGIDTFAKIQDFKGMIVNLASMFSPAFGQWAGQMMDKVSGFAMDHMDTVGKLMGMGGQSAPGAQQQAANNPQTEVAGNAGGQLFKGVASGTFTMDDGRTVTINAPTVPLKAPGVGS